MGKAQFTVGRGTLVEVAPVECDLVAPEDVIFTVTTTAVEVGGTTITITASTNTRAIATNPYLLFVDPVTGKESLVKVNGEIEAGDTSLTILAAKYPIATGATAQFPVRLSARSAANLASEDDEEEVESLDNGGWREYLKTSLGATLSCPGRYLATDAGWNTCRDARLAFEQGEPGKVFARVTFPTPGCNDEFEHGERISGIALVTGVPMEAGAKSSIMSNIDLKFSGRVLWEKAA